MSTDPTKHAPPIEPTTPAIYNHYEVNPYVGTSLPALPPPPPKRRASQGWIIAPICLVLLIVAGGALYYLMYRSASETPMQARVKVTPVSYPCTHTNAYNTAYSDTRHDSYVWRRCRMRWRWSTYPRLHGY